MKCFDPSISRTVTIGEKIYFTNDRYYLVNFSDWDEQIRDWLASKENIILEPEHHCVIQFLRANYTRTKSHPVVRTVTAELKEQFGKDKGSVKFFHSLFPLGLHQAFLIAGLPMQDSCC
jgi:TusE/DsrC/DsvC family sulfur relay protein